MAIDIEHIEESTKHGKTVGVIAPSHNPRIRKEIDEFIKNTDCFNLYLLALIDLQRLPDTDESHYYGTRRPKWDAPFSYFQIAGIHGKPFAPWDGVTQTSLRNRKQAKEVASQAGQIHEPTTQAGYCSHSSDLFPTWHRAYLAMFEQSVFLQMVNIANNFPPSHRKRYVEACEGFGLPYWDPFLPRRKILNKYGYHIVKGGIPVVLTTKNLRIRTPHAPDELSDAPWNPLYGYRFSPEVSTPRGSNWSEEIGYSFKDMFSDVMNRPNMNLNTIRGPSPAGTTNHQYVNNTLTNAVSTASGPALPLGSKIYRILQGPTLTYTQMANSAYISRSPSTQPTPNRENSLEGFHNDIHTMCGNGGDGRTGHMGLTEFAAFDPIFWLHHTNIDRLFAIWQALNPDTWDWHQNLLDSPTYVAGIGDLETPDTHLIPFRRNIRRVPESTFDPFADPDSTSRVSTEVDWWTSNDLRHCSSLGYTYPELQLVKVEGEKTDLRPLRQWVTNTYEWSTIYGEAPPWQSVFESEDFHRVEALPEVTRVDGMGEPVLKTPTAEAKSSGSSRFSDLFRRRKRSNDRNRYEHIRPLMKGHSLRHWNITVKVRKFVLNGSFQIFFFLGDFGDDPRGWSHERHLIGIDGIFANRHLDHCENCRRQEALGLEDSDTIALTTNLIAYWKNEEVHCGKRLLSLEPDDVLPFLKYNLHWRILDSYGRQHDPQSIESLHVTVGSQRVRLPTEFGAQPVYEDEEIHRGVATGA